jgi:hypothetical protein
MENRAKLFVYSERRFGKSSLVKLALSGLPKQRYIGVYIDLWATESEATFVTTMARAMASAVGTTPKIILETAKSFFSFLTPSVTIDDEGKPTLTFGSSKVRTSQPNLEEVLESPQKIADKSGRTVVVVFDEFQQILEYDKGRIERLLRSHIQHHDKVSYIFLGSRKHLMQEMFLDKSRPLFRIGGHYPLPEIATTHWIPFIKSRFAAADKMMTDDCIQKICEHSQNHPFYTQLLCHILWEIAPERKEVSAALLQEALDTLLKREKSAFGAMWDALTMTERKLLIGFAMESRTLQPFAAEFLSSCGIASASSTQRAARSLMKRDVIDKDESGYFIVDRFLALWIKKEHQF